MHSQSSKEADNGILSISAEESAHASLDPVEAEKRGTEFDGRDMNRMGKLPELRVCFLSGVIPRYELANLLQRNFRFPSIFGYGVVCTKSCLGG